MPSFFPDILALSALIQALAVYISEEKFPRHRINPQLLRYNKWQASRHGLKGRFKDPFSWLTDTQQTIGDSVLQMLVALEPHMIRLDSNRWATQVRHILERGSSTDKQRELVRDLHSQKNMIAQLQSEFWS